MTVKLSPAQVRALRAIGDGGGRKTTAGWFGARGIDALPANTRAKLVDLGLVRYLGATSIRVTLAGRRWLLAHPEGGE